MKVRIPNGPSQVDMMRQVQRMQEEMGVAQAALELKEYKAAAGGGVVSVTVTGKKEIIALDIKPEVVDPDDVEMLQDLIMAATNEAIKLAENDYNQTMNKYTAGLNIPGIG